jgi:hypothetical protein
MFAGMCGCRDRHNCASYNAILIFAGMCPTVRSLLDAHGALSSDSVRNFTSINEALKWSEQVGYHRLIEYL